MPINVRDLQVRAEVEQAPANEITPELVKQVVDRVYKLMLEEARIDFERGRPSFWRSLNNRGGR